MVAGLHADLDLTCVGCEIDGAAYADAEVRVKDVVKQLQARKEAS